MTVNKELSKIFNNIVEISKDYIENQGQKIYVYCVTERYLLFFNIFYQVDNQYLKKHEVNTVLPENSDEKQLYFLDEGMNYLEEFEELHQKYQTEVPTESWLIYDMETETLETKFNYDARYENSPLEEFHMTPEEEFDKWFEEVKAKGL